MGWGSGEGRRGRSFLLGDRGGVVVLSEGVWLSGPNGGDGVDNPFLHFFHVFLHAVLKYSHEVVEILPCSGSIEELFTEACVFSGCPVFVQKLAQINRLLSDARIRLDTVGSGS